MNIAVSSQPSRESEKTNCYFCGKEQLRSNSECTSCGANDWKRTTKPVEPKVKPVPVPVNFWGGLATIFGAVITLYYMFLFSTAVDVPKTEIPGLGTIGGGQVVNLSLLAQQQHGVMVGLALVLVGAILVVASARSKK